MRVLVMGCGRVGAGLASRLASEGHDVVIIDTDAFAFRRLLPRFPGRRLVGSGTDDRTLHEAGIEQADVFVALASGDNRNILAAQKAKHIYHVETVVTRVKDPLRAEMFGGLGLRTFSPTKVGIELAALAIADGDVPGLGDDGSARNEA